MTKKEEEQALKDHNAIMDAKLAEIFAHKSFTLGVKRKTEIASKIVERKEYLSSGSLNIDYMLGGGFLMGQMHEVWGNPTSGKTTSVLRTIEQAQKKKMIVGILDAEFTFDTSYAKKMGINTDHLVICKNACIEEAIEVMESWIESGVKLIVVDSITALRTKKELEDDFSKSQIAGNAKAVSKMAMRMPHAIAKANATLIGINQVRMNMGAGAMSSPFPTSWTKKYTRPGGVAWEHQISTSLLMEKKNDVVDVEGEQKELQTRGGFNKSSVDRNKRKQAARDRVVGHESMIACIKNKTAGTRGMQRRIYIDYAHGLDTASEIFDFCIDFDFIEKVNRKQKYVLTHDTGEMEEFDLSEKEMIRYIRENKELKESLYDRCRDAISEHLEGLASGVSSSYYVDSHSMKDEDEAPLIIESDKVSLGFS